MRLVRASWLMVLAAIILTAAVPALRRQLHLGLRFAIFAIPGRDVMQQSDALLGKMLKPYQELPGAFVEKHYPNDPQMLLAAAILSEDADALRRAAETANTPVAWAAYGERFMQIVPSFQRIGSSGVDPTDTEAVAQEQKRIAESGFPDRLTLEQADPILSALRSWQEADPDNALPVALEARILYGLHRDKDALAAWARAARMPRVTSHGPARAEALRRFFVARGMPEPESLLCSQVVLIFPSFARLRDIARIAVYEGRLAAMRDDPVTAIACWQNTADLGRHMQDSTDTIIGLLVGVAIEGIGASPVWQWDHDGRSGISGGPLFGGRYFWGDQHALYVGHMGEANNQALLDSLIRAKLRSQASRDYTRGFGMFEDYLRASRYLGFAAAAAGLAALLFALYLLFGTWSRRSADSATNLRPSWQLVLAALFLTPLAAAAIVLLRLPTISETRPTATATATLVTALAGFVLLIVVIPPLIAIRSRAPGARFRTAWRGNLRRLLPVSLALSALLCLGLNLYAFHLRSRWVAKWTAPGVTEMSDMIEQLGPRWTNPTIPPDASRAQYPPEASP